MNELLEWNIEHKTDIGKKASEYLEQRKKKKN